MMCQSVTDKSSQAEFSKATNTVTCPRLLYRLLYLNKSGYIGITKQCQQLLREELFGICTIKCF